jgi:hypothetical protein
MMVTVVVVKPRDPAITGAITRGPAVTA